MALVDLFELGHELRLSRVDVRVSRIHRGLKRGQVLHGLALKGFKTVGNT